MNEEITNLIPEWTKLLKSLKADIDDDYRASDSDEETLPGMCVTIGFTPTNDNSGCSWSYQTGDNSYSGGAYSHAHWAVISLYRRSNSTTLAGDIADQIAESVAQTATLRSWGVRE